MWEFYHFESTSRLVSSESLISTDCSFVEMDSVQFLRFPMKTGEQNDCNDVSQLFIGI